MITKAIHEMTITEAQSKLKEYETRIYLREKHTRILNDEIETMNYDSPDLRDCIRILKDHIKTHTP